MSATLSIGERTFTIHQRVQTPDGTGEVIGLDPFADEEIGVRLDDGQVAWFVYLAVEPEEPISREQS
jgi:hypothetical protein